MYIDVRTGEVDVEIQTDPMRSALNAEQKKHASLITVDYSKSGAKLSAIRRNGTNVRRTTNNVQDVTDNVQHATNKRVDPRYVRLLPWAVIAKDFSYNNPVAVQRFSWLRILTLSVGVFLLPMAVGWSCIRVRFSLRHLWVVATTIAVALSLVLADKSAHYPTDALGQTYLRAMQTSATIAVVIFLFALPIMELARERWRRRLSLGVYCGLICVIPVFTLLLYPMGAIRTTYTFQEFWHLFWFALLPTGAVLFLVHSLRILGGTTARIVRVCWRKLGSMRSSDIQNLQGMGDSHGA
jgi:hypothetical protein